MKKGLWQNDYIFRHSSFFISYGFLNMKRYSCAIRKKLYLMLFVFQYPVALQLCCSLIIISFVLNPLASNIFMASKLIGMICPFFLVSPIKTAQNFPFFSTLKHSLATFFISSRKLVTSKFDKSSPISCPSL